MIKQHTHTHNKSQQRLQGCIYPLQKLEWIKVRSETLHG